MTYPPQPGGQYPPQQPYPQQPQQPYAQQQPYPAQQPYSPQPWAPPGHPPPGHPPSKRKRGLLWLWIAVGAVVVLGAGVAVTGFVEPGFFLNKNHPVGAPATLDEARFVSELLAKVNNHDLGGAAAYVCESADESPASLVRGHFGGGPYRVIEVEPFHEITQFVRVESEPGGATATLMLRKGPDGGFCLFGVI